MQNQPPIFLINLDQSTDRLEKSATRLAEQGITFERISGVYGKALSNEEISKHYNHQINQQHFYRALGKGEIGCYFSHRKAWQTIVDRKLKYAIVLEDDFRVVGNLDNVFKTIESLTLDWKLIKLAAYENRERPIEFTHALNTEFDLVVHKKAMTGCCAQAITYEGAKALLKATDQFGRPVDTDIQHIWETKVPVYSMMPYYIEQDLEFDSDIAAATGKTKVKKRFWQRKKLQLCEKLLNKRHTQQVVENLKKALG
ncbi:glycosyltransferase family 25 protein [Pseudoalteromonas sp. SMS1]|uniref:glycosyltransferase family 25 protein n=1 Tax=Pseudoalteromonas sp. SMS1 TaxID=2908894 RepID=UPI001F187DEA|nr:glycosyltransferase family 25 protein [Pseudoalteromonas sp. SMS1]MCF2855992.1 glycosyltransferase family 25 protein [Pseudoalteromonas sp. SMS1]